MSSFNKVETVQGMFADWSQSVDSDEEYCMWSGEKTSQGPLLEEVVKVVLWSGRSSVRSSAAWV